MWNEIFDILRKVKDQTYLYSMIQILYFAAGSVSQNSNKYNILQ